MTPYYHDEAAGIIIYHGDARKVLPALADEGRRFGLAFTSPPYNLGNTTGDGFPAERMGHYAAGASMHKRGGAGKWPGAKIAAGYGGYDDAMPHEEYVAWQQQTVRDLWTLLNDGGAIFYNHKPRVLGSTLVTPFDYLPPELPRRQVVIWRRSGGINFSPSFYLPTHEWIVIVAKPGFRLRSRGASGAGDVWDVPQEQNNPHPAPFPLALPAKAIETTGCASVLDPFCGSGTTLRAAKDAGIMAVGIELEERHCELAAKRLSQGVLFGLENAP